MGHAHRAHATVRASLSRALQVTRGQGLVEYTLIVMLIALVAIAGLTAVGVALAPWFTLVAGSI